MDGDVVYTCRFYNLNEPDRLTVRRVSREIKKQLWPIILQVWVNSNLARDSFARSNPLLGLFDHGGDLVWVRHHAATDSFFHRPRLRTSTIQVNTIDPRTDHFCSTSKLDGVIRGKLCDNRALIVASTEIRRTSNGMTDEPM